MRRLGLMAMAVALAWTAAAAPSSPPPASEFRQALAPYLAAGPRESGWVLAGEPVVAETRPGAVAIQLPGLAYTYPLAAGAMTVDFGAVEAEAVREGDGWRVSIRPSSWITVSDAAGIAAEASVDVQQLTGLWLPGRGAFRTLEVRLHDLRTRSRNGDILNVAQLNGRFETAAAAMKGSLAVVGVAASAGSGATLGRAETANLSLALDGMDVAATLRLGWEHTRRQDMEGVPAELTPLRLNASAVLAPFPWRELLRHLPTVFVDLADAPEEGRAGLLRALWERLRPVLHQAETRARDVVVRANSASLAAHGRGEAFFSGGGGQTGRLVVDVRGINERIAALTPQDRRRYPMLFPSLALMTVLAEGLTEGGRRVHRYHVDLVDGGLKLNGADVSAIRPPKP